MIRSMSLFCLTVKVVSMLTLYPQWTSGSSGATSRGDRRRLFFPFSKLSNTAGSKRSVKYSLYPKRQRMITNHSVNMERFVNRYGVQSLTSKSVTLVQSNGLELQKRDGIQDHFVVGILASRLRQATEDVTNLRKRISTKLDLKSIDKKCSSPFRKNEASSQSSSSVVLDETNDDSGNDNDERNGTNLGAIKQALTQPLMEEHIWNQLDGTEFQRYPELLDELAKMGEQIASNDESSSWIDWKSSSDSNNSPLLASLKEGAIHVWIGKSKKQHVRGENVPWIKTRSILPFKPTEMVELLLDSKRVKTYNQWSLGRQDCWVATSLATNEPTNSGLEEKQREYGTNADIPVLSNFGLTKIVKNRVQPPLGARPMISTTLLHAQRVCTDSTKGGEEDIEIDNINGDTWIVVSRAVGGKAFADPDDHDVGNSEILLGVNLLQPCPTNRNNCILTAVTHVYSSAIPTLLAERVGVKSAIKFVKDMRLLKCNGDDSSTVDNESENKKETVIALETRRTKRTYSSSSNVYCSERLADLTMTKAPASETRCSIDDQSRSRSLDTFDDETTSSTQIVKNVQNIKNELSDEELMDEMLSKFVN